MTVCLINVRTLLLHCRHFKDDTLSGQLHVLKADQNVPFNVTIPGPVAGSMLFAKKHSYEATGLQKL
jgi:hypothetical protein